MEKHAEDARRKAMVIDIDMLVPKDHLLRKIEKVMDYDWLYERLNPLYNDKVGRPGTDPVVLIKMVLIQHLFGIPSLRQTWRECDVNVAYRWFLGYDLLEHIPHFATVSYAFCNRFPAELSVEIFDHILNKALNNRMVDPSVVFIDGTHIKAMFVVCLFIKSSIILWDENFNTTTFKQVIFGRLQNFDLSNSSQ